MALAAGNNDGEVYQSTVFLTTSLDTRLVTTVSGSDTVSDFKKKVMLEHIQCFPAIGNIKIHSLKVKRRGVFYHLSDSMLVKSAFGTTKGNWFVSVDASSLEQDIDTQHFDEQKAEDRLALPCVTRNFSINRHDNHGSLLVHPKTVPFVNQILSNVDGDSCKDVSNNIEEVGPSNDKQLDINTEMNSKKRIRDVSNEDLLKDSSGVGIAVKKKRKTQRVKSNVKGSEENIVLAYDDDMGKDRGVSMNNENSFEHKSNYKDLIGENTKTKNSEKGYDLDQVAAVVPSCLEGVGRETVADVVMMAEKNIQNGMSEKVKENELIQKAVIQNEIPSSSMRTSDCECDAAGLPVMGPPKGSYKHSSKAAEKEVSSTSFLKNLHNTNKDASDSSQQDVGSNCQNSEVKLPERRKKIKKSATKNKNETLVMRADNNLVGEISSRILDPISDEKIIGEKNEVLETALVDGSKKNDDMIVKGVEISGATKSCRNRVRVENMEEKQNNKLKDIVGSRKRKKDVEKTSSKNAESVVKHSDGAAISMHALHVDCFKNDVILMNNEIELLRTEKSLNVDNIDDKSEKQNEKMDGVKKNRRKKKTKKSASRNEESITKNVNGDIYDNVNEGDTEVELESKKSQSVDHHHHLEDTSKNVTVSEVSKDNNEVDITNDRSHGVNFMDQYAPANQPNEIASIDSRKDTKKPKKKTKDDSRNDSDIQSQQTKNEALVGKEKKNNNSSLRIPQDRRSKLQSTEFELESKKSQSIDQEHNLEDASKNVTESAVLKVNNEVGIINDVSSEINFMDHFAQGHQPNKIASIDNVKVMKKPMKKTKDDFRNDGAIRSQKILSENENNKVVTDPNIPNIDQIRTPKTTRNIDAESSSSSRSKSFGSSFHNKKSNKRGSVEGPMKKVLPVGKSLLNTPGKIFGDDDSDRSSADDNAAVNSDSSTRTPSRKSTSSSSSGDSAFSIDSRRNRSHAMKRKVDDGKNRRTPQEKSKKASIADLLRSSSRFKKAKFTASQHMEDPESQPVDFVPDTQPLG